LCRRRTASRGRPPPVHRSVDASRAVTRRSGDCEHCLLSRIDGASRLADGDCSFVACAVPARALPRTFRRSRQKRPGNLRFAPSGNCDGKRNRQFLIHNSSRDFGSLNNIKIMNTKNNEKKLIAVIGATGQQGGGVVRALQASGQFNVRALSRNPGKHRDLADEVVEADLSRPETLKGAFEGANGVFLVSNFAEAGTDEFKQATMAV